MTKKRLKEAARRSRDWRKRNPKRAIQISKNWKTRNPGWFRGRNYVKLLETALIVGNEKSKVFKDAGMAMDEWIGLSCFQDVLTHEMNGSKLVPVKSWLEFDLSLPSDVRRFLDPRNFRLIAAKK